MNDRFRADYHRMTGETWTGSVKNYIKILAMHNLRFMKLYRSYEKKKSLLTRLRLYRMSRKYGLEISVHACIGDGLYLGHPYNITVAEGVTIGKNVNLHKGCTIGRENRGKRAGVPTIGNNVFVGVNAVIVGNIHIGDDVMIAPNAFVNFDVPSHSIVVGNPASVHSREHAVKNYVNYRA